MKDPVNPIPPIQGMRAFSENESHIRRCKIVGTLGPASSDPNVLEALIEAGLDIARLNFSHGSHQDHLTNIQNIRSIAKKNYRHVTILQDLQGPKIRCGHLINGAIKLLPGSVYELVFGTQQTEAHIIPIDYKDLVRDVKVGQRVMMDDGLLILEVAEVLKDRVKVEVKEGGLLKNRKGVNFPDSLLSLPALTEKDSKDLLFGVQNGVDVIALSFVQSPADVLQCKKIISALGADTPVVAKIEKLSAIDQIEEIAKVADGLMVARGDLGVEGSVEKVPKFQRKIIEAAARQSKPVIVATQMLESMVNNPRASLAEVTDVANGVLEGADCVMLSAEVAAGKYPVKCVEAMAAIIKEVEQWPQKKQGRPKELHLETSSWQEHEAIARAACEAADECQARAIVCLTLTGSIARLIARWRPKVPIIAISPRPDVIQRLGFTWGVYGMKNPLFYNTDVLLQDLPQMLKSLGIVKSKDLIVITAGIPLNAMKPTNMLKINRIP